MVNNNPCLIPAEMTAMNLTKPMVGDKRRAGSWGWRHTYAFSRAVLPPPPWEVVLLPSHCMKPFCGLRLRAIASAYFSPPLQLCCLSRNGPSSRACIATGPETQLDRSSTSNRRFLDAVRPRSSVLVSYDVNRLAERGCAHGSDITPHVNVITYVSRDFLNM